MSAEVIDFLRVLHEDASGKVEIRLIADTKDRTQALPIRQRWYDLDQLAARLPEITTYAEANGYAMFYGVLPRVRDGGTAADVGPARTLWCDLDYKDVPEAEAWRRVDGFPVPPSIVVCSGHGLHLYWRLQEAEEPHVLASICKRIAFALGGDHCFDAARILRLPGSRNLKACWTPAGFTFDAGHAPAVEIRRYEPARCCQPWDFDDLAEAPADVEAKREKVKFAKVIGAKVPEVVSDALVRFPRLAALWRSEGKAHGDTSGSGYDVSFCCALVGLGIRDPDVLAAAVALRPRVGESKPATVRSVKRSVERALAVVPVPPPAPEPPAYDGPPPEDEPPAERVEDDPRRQVLVNRERLSVVESVWAGVHAANDPPRMWQQAGQVVALRRPPDAPSTIYPFSAADITGVALRSCRFLAERVKDGAVVGYVNADPPKLAMADMLALPDSRLPVLTSIIRCPVLDKDGRLVIADGYDYPSGLYYDPPEGFEVRLAAPTKDNAIIARDVLLTGWLGEFPFASPVDKAHALALLILPFVRRMISGPTPLHLIEASERGTGKSLLAELLMVPALGRFPDGAPLAEEDDEVRKKLTATLIGRPQVVYFDNLAGAIDSPSLCIALTSSRWEDRILGVSGNASAPIDCAWLATGNNVELSTDLARRTIRSRLDRGMERPWEFKPERPNIRPYTLANRHLLVSAALTMCSAWVDAGKPTSGASLGSFESWAEVVGGILAYAEQPGFLANVREMYESADPAHIEWRALILEWWHAFGDRTSTASQLAALADEHNLLSSVLGGATTDRSKSSRIGRGLARQRDRIFSGLRLTSAVSKATNQTEWALVVAEPEAVPVRVVRKRPSDPPAWDRYES